MTETPNGDAASTSAIATPESETPIRCHHRGRRVRVLVTLQKLIRAAKSARPFEEHLGVYAMVLVGLFPSSPAARVAASHVVKGHNGGGRLCFGRTDPAASVQLPSDEPGDLWSPPPKSPQPIRQRMRDLGHMFAARGTPPKAAAPPAEPVLSPDATCCICLEDAVEGGGSGIGQRLCSMRCTAPEVLRCPQCTMTAHPTCLARWFGTSVGASGNGPLPKSSAHCPNCRCVLDWDALALQARRKKMPALSMVLAASNAEFDKENHRGSFVPALASRLPFL